MIYAAIFALIVLIINTAKRNIGAALLIVLAMITVDNLVGSEIVKFLAGLGLPKAILPAIINLVLIIIPMLVVLFRAQKYSRRLPMLIFDGLLLFALVISASHAALTTLVGLDSFSLQIQDLIVNNYKLIIVTAGFYGFYQVIVKPEIE